MSEHKLACPPGVQLYVSEMAHARAVEALWETEARVPRDLPVGNWPDYGRAWLTAQAVKVDLLAFFHEIWTRTWGDAFGTHFPGSRFLRECDLAERGVHKGSIQDAFAWVARGDNITDHTLFVVVETPAGGVIETSLYMDDAFRVGLWIGSNSTAIPAPSVPWSLYDDGGFIVLSRGTVSSDGLDLGFLREQAAAAVANLILAAGNESIE